MVKMKQKNSKDTILTDTPLRTTPDALGTDIDDQRVILNISNGDFFETNASGRTIWALVEEGLTINEIVSVLQKRFLILEDQCRKDVCDFVLHMVGHGLIEYEQK